MEDKLFELVSKYKPQGDQPKAIEELVNGIKEGKKQQVLLGATGTGKTFTISNVIAQVNKPTLVFAHNKTLAGSFFLITELSILCQTSIIISQKLISQAVILI